MSERHFDVVIIGAGVIGCAAAYELQRRGGTSVLVLDRGEPGHGASRAALGGLPPCLEPAPTDDMARISRRSLGLYPEWTAALREETGVDPEFSRSGSLLVGLRPDDLAVLEERHAWLARMGWPAERLTREQLARSEPGLNAGIAGLLMPEDACVNNGRLMDALVESLRRSDTPIRTGCDASLWCAGGTVRGVQVGSARIEAGAVINAAGAAAGRVGGPALPIYPVRGQALALRGAALPSARMVASPQCYFVPRNDGTLILGSTVEPHVDESLVTAGGCAALLNAGRALWPPLDACRFLGAWAGLRAESADRLPVLGRWPGLPNLFVAAGFFKMGITLAPLAARALADEITGGRRDPALDLLTPERFAVQA